VFGDQSVVGVLIIAGRSFEKFSEPREKSRDREIRTAFRILLLRARIRKRERERRGTGSERESRESREPRNCLFGDGRSQRQARPMLKKPLSSAFIVFNSFSRRIISQGISASVDPFTFPFSLSLSLSLLSRLVTITR